MEIETSQTAQEKMKRALGFTTGGGKGLDALHREDFASDNEYLNAVAEYDMQQKNPEFAAARHKAEREYHERLRQQEEAELAAAVEEAKKKVVLTDADKAAAEARARARAQRDLAQGRISYRDMGEAIEKYCKEEEDAAKKDRMNSATINAMLRGSAKKFSHSATGGAGAPMRRIGR